MIKQPTQPLKIFTSYLEVEQDWKNRRAGNQGGTHIITEDILFLPPLQVKFDNRVATITDFQNNVMELINYQTGVIIDITGRIRAMGVFTYEDYQNFILYRFPMTQLFDEGNYYLKISDGTLNVNSPEIWYSEVFQLCGLNRNLVDSITEYNWGTYETNDYISTKDVYEFSVCDVYSTGYFYMGDFHVVKDERLDLYIHSENASISCAYINFLPLSFALIEYGTNNIISNVEYDVQLGSYKFTMIPTETCRAQLYVFTHGPKVGRSKWHVYLFYANPQKYSGSKDDNIGTRKVLRWANSCNICDMIYEQQEGYVVIDELYHYWQMVYENYLILDDPPLIPEYEISVNASENEKEDKLQLLGFQKGWEYLKIASTKNLAKAIQNIHLHDTIEIYYNGEVHTICETGIDIEYGDDYNFLTKFRFREETCAVDSCCLKLDECDEEEEFLYSTGNLGHPDYSLVGDSSHSPTIWNFKNKTYLVWMKKGGAGFNCDSMIMSYNHLTGERSDSYICNTGIAGGTDPHAYPSVIVADDGHIIVAREKLRGTGENNHNSMIYINKSDYPEDETSWVQALAHNEDYWSDVGDDSTYRLTYSVLAKTKNGFLYMWARDIVHKIRIYKSMDNGVSWDGFGTGEGPGLAVYDGPVDELCYNEQIKHPLGDKLFMVINPAVPGNYRENIFYIWSYDGITWRNVDNSWTKNVQTAGAITFAEASANCLVINNTNPDGVFSCSGFIDENDYPHLLLIQTDDAGASWFHTYCYWNGAAWVNNNFNIPNYRFTNHSDLYKYPNGNSAILIVSRTIGADNIYSVYYSSDYGTTWNFIKSFDPDDDINYVATTFNYYEAECILHGFMNDTDAAYSDVYINTYKY